MSFLHHTFGTLNNATCVLSITDLEILQNQISADSDIFGDEKSLGVQLEGQLPER